MPTVARKRTSCQICHKPCRVSPIELTATGLPHSHNDNRVFIKQLCRQHQDELEAFLTQTAARGPAVFVPYDTQPPRLNAADFEALRTVGAWRVVKRRARRSAG